jgi:cytoskeletal protein CcmA (bactofilin family)
LQDVLHSAHRWVNNDGVIHPPTGVRKEYCMLNFDRGNRPANPKDPVKPAPKPLYEPPASSTGAQAAPRTVTPSAPSAPPAAASASTAAANTGAASAAGAGTPAPASATTAAPLATQGDGGESRLFIGVNIKLKGVEISDCDAVVIEGHVDATVNSKAMEIKEPGTFKGTAQIDVAEIHGEFIGELTARTRLIVHGTGRVSGTIRYGKLVVEEGGEISGDLQRIDRDTRSTHHGTHERLPLAAGAN